MRDPMSAAPAESRRQATTETAVSFPIRTLHFNDAEPAGTKRLKPGIMTKGGNIYLKFPSCIQNSGSFRNFGLNIINGKTYHGSYSFTAAPNLHLSKQEPHLMHIEESM